MKRSTPYNETKCGKAAGKKLIASEYCMCQGTMDSSNYDCEYCRDGDRWGNKSVQESPIAGMGFSGYAGE